MREIDPRALAERLAAGLPTLLVDVRERWEHALASLPASVLVPLGELQARVHEIVPAADALVVTYCHHGVRSLQAARVLAGAGFADVVSLAGGIDGWSRLIDAGVPRY